MELKGLKVNFLGDSITFGVGASAPENSYSAVFARENDIALIRNYGISGTRIARQSTASDYPPYDQDFCGRFSLMDKDADLNIVFGGTNDFGHGDAPIGNFDDRTPDTFYGACHTLFSGLLEQFPDTVTVILTPLHRSEEKKPFDSLMLSSGDTLKEYVDVIKEVAEYYSLPVLDLWATSGIVPRVPIIKEKYCPDGLHPNDAGHRRIAERLAAFLKAL